jgi:DNA repair exonuclease SbcCD ATPase subunit
MGRVYQLVREVVQGTLSRTTPDATISHRSMANEDSLSDAVEELDKLFVDGIRRLKSAVSDNRTVALGKIKHAEQVIDDLKTNIIGLEARVRETEDTLHNQNVAGQKMEDSLKMQIDDLERVLKEKEEALQSRIYEVNDLTSKIDAMADQVTHLVLVSEQARREAANKVQEAERIIEDLKANVTGLETRVKEAEDTVERKDAALQNLGNNLTAEIRDLQSVVTKKDQALESREAEVNDLRSKLEVMAEQVSQSELAVGKVKGVAASKIQEAEQVIEGLKSNIIVLEAKVKAKLSQAEQNDVDSTDASIKKLDQDRNESAIDLDAHSQLQRNETTANMAQAFATLQARATARITDVARETVPPEAFVRIVAEFSRFANVIENVASLIIRDHVRTLGESMEEFPQKRLSELIESLSNEISHNKLKADFRELFASVNRG